MSKKGINNNFLKPFSPQRGNRLARSTPEDKLDSGSTVDKFTTKYSSRLQPGLRNQQFFEDSLHFEGAAINKSMITQKKAV